MQSIRIVGTINNTDLIREEIEKSEELVALPGIEPGFED